MFLDDELLMITLVVDEEEEALVKKRMWVHQAWKNRPTEGEYATLYKELIDDESKFYEHFRMSENSFNLLLRKLEVHLKKQDTHWRKAITPRERLAVCLRYLGTGDALRQFRLAVAWDIAQFTVSYTKRANLFMKICRTS